ncbi:MAG: isoprenyl transferase [Epulopiscium sp.]|nr:isoprenyl transferase [Candidatus Epulonipiscium sp.]
MNTKRDIDWDHLPNHIAIIMDGNGRWAQKHNKSRTEGHRAGSDNLETITKEINRLGVSYATVYAFSTENWKRPKGEVDFLMGLLRQYLKKHIHQAKKENVKVRIIGERKQLAEDIQKQILILEDITKDKTGLFLQIALNYGGRDELVRSMQKIGQDLLNNKVVLDDINEEIIQKYLDTAEIPDPDLLIRTSGEIRLSNFLLWQLAYTELYFTEKYWPDFSMDDLYEAIYQFQQRKRRFGAI